MPRYRVIITAPGRKPFRVMVTANSDTECVEEYRACIEPGMTVEISRPDQKIFIAKLERPDPEA